MQYSLEMAHDPTVKGHPANKDVTLRMTIPVGESGEVIVTLFGGQGTINVPSWSPDSTRFAFVSCRLVGNKGLIDHSYCRQTVPSARSVSGALAIRTELAAHFSGLGAFQQRSYSASSSPNFANSTFMCSSIDFLKPAEK